MNLRTVDINLLVVFDALMTERQVTRAASKIGLSQSAVSSALGRLRRTFKDELLIRTASGMEPTPRALELIDATRRGLREIERVFDDERRFVPAQSEAVFRVRMGDLHGLLLLPAIMARVEREAPGVALNVVHLPPLRTVEALEADELDFAISTELRHPKSVLSQALYTDRMACVFRTGHPLTGLELTLKRFLSCLHVKVSQSPVDTRFIDDALSRRGLKRKIALNVEHWLAAPYIVQRTDLVTAMWRRMALAGDGDGKLTMCDLPFGPEEFTFDLYWHRRYEAHPAHRWMRNLVGEVCRSLP
jgi:DNA-binding transcriptional LysR family regulator